MFGYDRYSGKPATPVTTNLLIINTLLLFATFVFNLRGVDLTRWLGLHYFEADYFNPIQFLTYMFMHANISHLFFNMFTLYMFGKLLEMTWGSGRFLIYYLVTGLGAGIVQQLAWRWQIQDMIAEMNLMHPDAHITYGMFLVQCPWLNNFVTIGASGAVFGILLAFGMMFPNAELLLLIPPMPIKAKWLVIGYGVIELVMGVAGTSGDNVAHFAHLGGMLFGLILILMWRRHRNVERF